MTKDKLIEATARAMCLSGGFNPDEPAPNDGPFWRYYTETAQAALAVIAPAVLDLAAETATCGDTGTRLSEQIIADEIRALKERFV